MNVDDANEMNVFLTCYIIVFSPPFPPFMSCTSFTSYAYNESS
jgi:hypothetical protein